MQTGDNSIIAAPILFHNNSYTCSAFICNKIQVYDIIVVY